MSSILSTSEESTRIGKEDRLRQSRDQLLKTIVERTLQLTSKGEKVARFEIGEPNFPPSSKVIRGLTETFREKKIVGYGPAAGIPELRKALADELNSEHDCENRPGSNSHYSRWKIRNLLHDRQFRPRSGTCSYTAASLARIRGMRELHERTRRSTRDNP